MKRAILLTMLTSLLGLFPLTTATAAPCATEVDYEQAETDCTLSDSDAKEYINQGTRGPAPTHNYDVIGICLTTQDRYPECDLKPCPPEDGGFYYSLRESPIAADPPQWSHIGYVCLDRANELLELSAETVAREFKRLSWPQAELAIQPPDGETLVNLPTVFRAENPDPITQTVTLLGHNVDIEATPIEWTWHWAQPSDNATDEDKTPQSADEPGAPHPNASITHAYRLADITVSPSLDVTYQGRFRVDGGAWEDIPDTHTVNGTPGQTLTVLEARPTLMR